VTLCGNDSEKLHGDVGVHCIYASGSLVDEGDETHEKTQTLENPHVVSDGPAPVVNDDSANLPDFQMPWTRHPEHGSWRRLKVRREQVSPTVP